MTSVRKHGTAFAVSREVAIAHGLVEPTPEEAAAEVAQRAHYKALGRQAWVDFDAAMAALDRLDDPGLRAVLALHAPNLDGWEARCSDCIDGGDMDDPTPWPCNTVQAVAGAYGIPLPTWTLYTNERHTSPAEA